MENIKSSLDKIMENLNDSVTHSAPKKLHFEYLNDSLNDCVLSKKRRLDNTDSFNLKNDTISPASLKSLDGGIDSAPPSPWETRRLKADLIQSRTMISKLKQEIDRQHRLRVEIETMCGSEVTELKKQCSYSADKVLDMERHLQTLRKREQGVKQELLRVKKEMNQQKDNFEEALLELERKKIDAEDNFRQLQNSSANKLSAERMHSEKLQSELELVTDELINTRSKLEQFEGRAGSYDALIIQSEKDHQELSEAQSRIKELENEIASHNEWKEIIQSSQASLFKIPDIEKECERLKVYNKQLQTLLGNKLLLEEEVHDLQTKLNKESNASAELVSLKVKCEHMELELKEWVRVAQDHCTKNMLVSPMALRSRIEQILQNDIVVTSEQNSKLSEAKCKESELLDVKQKCEIYSKNIDDLNIALKRHKTFRERVQKKLLLVSKERDCYKNLIESFEKDLTVSSTNGDLNAESYLRTRLEASEKTLSSYKEMCGNLEKELAYCKQLTTADKSIERTLHAEEHTYLKKELNTLRMENDRLRRRKDELELELEQRYVKSNCDADKYKAVHFVNNPAAEAYANAENIVEKLQAEIERLKRRNKKLEEDNEITQNRLTETVNMTMNIKEINQLQGELEAANAKVRKLTEYYKAANGELREVCYMLFGYRIDRIGPNSNYKLSSMYAESGEDYLNFRLNESNLLDMLETPYSITLKPLIESQLIGNKSLPVFLSSLTLDLFQRSTITIN